MASRIRVEDIRPGMILAEPIVNKHQKEVLPGGTKLTEYHTTFFKNCGIQFVAIDHDLEGVDSELNSEIRALATQRVEKRMGWKPCNPMEEEIYRLAIHHAERLLLEERVNSIHESR
jgi:hypothetical protein